MQSWFAENPNPTGGIRDLQWDTHKFGRNIFASNFARNGMSASMFGRTAGDRFRSALGRTHKAGSPQHIRNLEYLASMEPDNPNLVNALEKAKTTSQGSKSLSRTLFGGALKVGMGTAFVALPAFTTPGGISEKGRAVAGGLAGWAGWSAGATLGAAIGSVIPVIGAPIGALAGGLAASIGADEGMRALLTIPDNMVERERKRRNLNWVGNQDAFNTRSAATMRQMSLQAMNRGMATGRSALGREAVMFHR